MNIKMQNHSVRFALACLVLILGVAWGSPGQATMTAGTSTAPTGVTYSGQAFGAFVNVILLGLGVGPETLSDTGELPPSGGLLTNQLENVSIPGVLSVTIMPTMTSGANGVARSEASLADVVVLPSQVPGQSPLLTASFVQAESEATCNGVRGETEVADLKVASQAITVDPFAPNQMFGPITVPGVGDVTLVINEQQMSSGGGTQDITVNALHLTVKVSGIVAAEVILSHAHSDVQGCPGCPPTPPCHDFMTGGGWIKVDNSKANFGFNAGYKPNATTPEIHFNYIDHYTGMHMKATSISVYRRGDTATTRHMEGNAEINGTPGFTYSIDAADNGEPGRNTDTLKISLSNANGIVYSAGGPLGGGNIQLHKPCP